MSSDLICVGLFVGAFGVHGDVRLKSYCSDPEAIVDYQPISSENGEEVFDIKILKPVKNGFSVQVAGIDTKEMADTLNGIKLFAKRVVLPSLPDDEFYHTDLIGLTVLDTGGTVLGKVASVANHGAGDFLEITGDGLKNPALLPFTQAAVPNVDLTAQRIIVDPPKGVFPE